MFAVTMGRDAKFDVKSLKIGQKLPFPANRKEYIYQYLNNFNRVPIRLGLPNRYKKVEKDGKLFIERVS